MNTSPLRIAVVGMKGYSRVHIDTIRKIQGDDPGLQLVAVSNYRCEAEESDVRQLENSGVQIVAGLPELLAVKPAPDIVTIPTGIHLHAPMALAALAHGCAVVVEKPVAATVQDVDALIAERDRTGRPVVVGFQHLAQARFWHIKRRLREGIIGRVHAVRGMAAAPRYESYYQRTGWAGKMMLNGSWVLDSPFNNACAHYLLQCLFFAQNHQDGTAQPLRVAAELYRAQPIESPDTACIDIVTRDGVRVIFTVSHAVEESFAPETTVCGDKGNLIITQSALFLERNGHREQIDDAEPAGNPIASIIRLLRGESAVPYCSLEMARPHTVAVNGAHLSSPIHAVPPDAVSRRSIKPTETTPPDSQYCIKNLFAAMQQAYQEGTTLHQTGALPWTRQIEPVDVSELTEFNR